MANGKSTFRILLTIIVAVTILVVMITYLGDKSITYCYGQVTLVQDGVGCPTPKPDPTR
jgi:hypothetical protein